MFLLTEMRRLVDNLIRNIHISQLHKYLLLLEYFTFKDKHQYQRLGWQHILSVFSRICKNIQSPERSKGEIGLPNSN